MSGASTDRVRVLVVEDHQVMADALTEALASHPAIEVIGTDGTLEEARRRVEHRAPDVVLMDVRLPDGDGAAGTAELLALAPQAQVVILSALTGIDVIARAVEAGASGFVSKTEPLETLTSAILRVHEGEALFSVETLSAVASHLRRGRRRPGADLTEREREVLALLAAGTSTEAIAERLVLSVHTVRNHVRNLLTKLHAHTKLEAVAIALRERLVEIPDAPG